MSWGWSGDSLGTVSTAIITMTRDMLVTASFEQSWFTVYLPLVVKDY